MKKQVQLFNSLSEQGLELLASENYQCYNECDVPELVLVRSANLHDYVWPNSVLAVGRAGTGVNNLPLDRLSRHGIGVFNAPGANANAVKELVLAGLLMSARHLSGAMNLVQHLQVEPESWASTLEANKKTFAGRELSSLKLGVIGLGAIGVQVANAAEVLGMEVIGYDPNISVHHAWHLSAAVKQAYSLNSVLQDCDFISVHVPLVDGTHHLIHAGNLALCHPDTVLLNFSRAEIVDDHAVLQALEIGALGGYVTDFPTPANRVHPKVLAFPHLGASTQQAEDAAAKQVIQQLLAYLKTGAVQNSVNLPDMTVGPIPAHAFRLAIVHANEVGMIAKMSDQIGQAGFNILSMANQSRSDLAYSLIDCAGKATQALCQQLRQAPQVYSVRVCGD